MPLCRQLGVKGFGAMLTILGLLGVLMAGVSADALLGGKDFSSDNDDEPSPPDEPETGHGDLLEDLSGPLGLNDVAIPLPEEVLEVPETSPISDDIEEEHDEAVMLVGGSTDDILSGANGDDQISGGQGSDQIDGMGGADSIAAGEGNDAVWAGAGNDSVTGGPGQDTLLGGDGDDWVLGGLGRDSICGQDGDDTLMGEGGTDTVFGGSGNDSIDGGLDEDWLAGGEGEDRLSGGAGSDILDGNAGDDWISGLNGAVDDGALDFINGGTGNDTMILGRGDFATGGEGGDSFELQDGPGAGEVATISDYDFTQDQIVVVYDQAVHPNPQLSLATKAGSDDVTILIDGAPVALVRGGSVYLSDIRLTAA